MEYRLGNSKRIYDIGETAELTCPKCSNKVNFSVYSNFNARLTAKMPLIKAEYVYFLICPKCSSVFGVDNSKGKQFKKGEMLSIGNFDLKELEKFEV